MKLNTSSAHNHKFHSLPSQAHSAPFRFIPSSLTQQAAVHPLPLLCSPALSFGLRAVLLFVSSRIGSHTTNSIKKTRQPLFVPFRLSCRNPTLPSTLIVRTALRFVPSLSAPCSHPYSCSRTHPAKRGVRLGRLAIRQRPSRC
jgi:hypothetical protein